MNTSEKSKIDFITIAICTYKREKELERLLENLCNLIYPENIKTKILVIDNDINKSAENIYEKFTKKLNINYFVEENKGLSNVRNRALKESINLGATHIAFIDDDEIADKNWLLNHIDFYNKFPEIYVSSGPTFKKFENTCPDYIANNKTFNVITRKKYGDLKKTCASGNVFFPLNIIKDNNLYFDEKFNFSGSEDTDFFKRINDNGFKIGWNNKAINYEIVPEERANIKWILKRAFNDGHSVTIAKFKNNNNLYKKIIYAIEKFFTIIINIITSIVFVILGRTRFFNLLTDISKNIGKFAGTLWE